ncbi:hypothetical protein ACQP3C_27370, partial [Escherichia coli]
SLFAACFHQEGSLDYDTFFFYSTDNKQVAFAPYLMDTVSYKWSLTYNDLTLQWKQDNTHWDLFLG